MVEKRNAEQFSGLTQPLGQDSIFWARRDVPRGMIMRACDVKSR